MHSLLHKIGCLLLLFFGAIPTINAQADLPLQLEFPTEKYSSQQHIIPCNDAGFCHLYPTFTPDSILINLHHYNANLSLVNQQQFALNKPCNYIASTFNQGKVYVLYQSQNKKKRENFGYLITYTLQNHQIDTLYVQKLPTEEIFSFTAYNDHLFFTYTSQKENRNLCFLPAHQHYSRSLFLPNITDYDICDFLVDTIHQRVLACINSDVRSQNSTILICETTLEGEITHIVNLPDTDAYRFQNAKIAAVKNDQFFIAGTFQYRDHGNDHTTKGAYSTLYDHETFTQPQWTIYPPTDLAANSTRLINSEVRYLPGKIYHDSTHYLFITEAFYPEYRYSTYYSFGMPTTERVFAGYRFVNAEVTLYDSLGNFVWEYTIPFENMLVSNLTPHLHVSFTNHNILLYYTHQGELVHMLTNETLEILEPLRISALFDTHTNSNEAIYTASLTPWYKNYHLLQGYKYKNIGKLKTKNPIYFIQKLQYQ